MLKLLDIFVNMSRYILPNHKSVRLAVLQIELYKHSWSFCSGFDSHVIHVLVQLVLYNLYCARPNLSDSNILILQGLLSIKLRLHTFFIGWYVLSEFAIKWKKKWGKMFHKYRFSENFPYQESRLLLYIRPKILACDKLIENNWLKFFLCITSK